MSDRVLPSSPFTTPMPSVEPPRQPLLGAEVDNSALVAVLAAHGATWPLNGFAPGRYFGRCGQCGKAHMADKRSLSCLPCAIVRASSKAKDSALTSIELQSALSVAWSLGAATAYARRDRPSDYEREGRDDQSIAADDVARLIARHNELERRSA